MKQRFSRWLAPVIAMLLVLTLFAGCGASDKASADTAMATEDIMPEESAYDESGFDAGTVYDDDTEVDLTTDSAGSGAIQPAEETSYTEKIIYSGYLNVETTEFDRSLAALDAMVESFGGFLENSDVSGYTTTNSDGTTSVVDRYAYYVMRVPCERFDEFMSQAGSIGNVINHSKNAENITSQFTDTEAYLESLNLQEERLLAMLESATYIDTLVTLEARLSEVRYEIESATRTLRNWQQQVDYSTVTVNLQEVAIYTPTAATTRTFGERISDAFADGWQGFGHALERLIVGLVTIWPLLILLAVIVVVIILLVKRSNKKARQRYLAQQTPPEEK